MIVEAPMCKCYENENSTICYTWEPIRSAYTTCGNTRQLSLREIDWPDDCRPVDLGQHFVDLQPQLPVERLVQLSRQR